MTDMNRRALLGAGATLGAGLMAVPHRAFAQEATKLTMAIWGGKAEVDAYNAVIAKYQAAHPNVSIRLDAVPFGQFYQQIDTRLAGRQAPDIFRITYQQAGRYALGKGTVDLSKYLESGYGQGFTPAVWNAVTLDGKPYALPHHTDTFALFYNADMLERVGVTPPTSLETAWTWEQFIAIARTLKEKQAAPYPFSMAWQNQAVHRWLVFLHQHGGQLVSDDLKSSRVNSKAGIETLAWNQSWFKEGLAPPSTSVKSTEATQNLFANGVVAMMLNGNWQIPFVQQQMKGRWGVTYLPRDVAMADDLGGTCVAISRDCKAPEIAADFLKFLVNEENMRDFVDAAQFIPVRKTLVETGVTYALRPDEMKVFTKMSTTISDQLVNTVVLPNWGKFNPRLADELDLCFTSGQSPEETAKNIEAHVQTILLATKA